MQLLKYIKYFIAMFGVVYEVIGINSSNTVVPKESPLDYGLSGKIVFRVL